MKGKISTTKYGRVDFLDAKPDLTWSLFSWVKRTKWIIRQLAKKYLP